MIAVAVCVLPIVLVAVIAVSLLASVERQNGRVQIMATGRATAGVVEQQLRGGIADLRTLADLFPVANGDLRRFFDECKAISQRNDGWILFSHASGEVIFDTRQQLGSAPSDYEDKTSFAQVVATKEIVVTNLFLGGADRLPQFSIHLPIADREKVRYILTLSYPAAMLAEKLAAQRLPGGWPISIADRDQVVVATTAFGVAVGQRLPAALPRLAPEQKEGLAVAVDDEGAPIYLVAIRSGVSGWETTVGVPQAVVDAPIGAALQLVLGGGSIVLLAGIVMAFVVGRRLSRAMATLSASAVGLVDMKPVDPIISPVREVNDLAVALTLAGERLGENDRGLRGVEEHLARAQIVAAVGSFEHDFASSRTEWTDACYAIFGQSPVTFTPSAMSFLASVHMEDRTAARQLLARLRQGRAHVGTDLRIVRPTGEVRTVHLEVEMLRDAETGPTGYIGTCHDITDRCRLEAWRRQRDAELQQFGKLEAVDALVGGIANDIGTAVRPVVSLTKTVRNALPPGSPERDQLEVVIDAGTRIRDLVKRITALGRRGTGGQTTVDVVQVVRDALRVLRATLPPHIVIECEIGSVAPISGDPAQLQQMIASLVTNAAQAIGDEGGTILVGLDAREGQGRNQRRLVLSITDTGRGMDEAARRRIFEPFVTSRNAGKGSGLGLAFVHGVVARHKATIEVASEVGRGTRFEIAFAIADPAMVVSDH
jgi:PAS domain S-box-containing protein